MKKGIIWAVVCLLFAVGLLACGGGGGGSSSGGGVSYVPASSSSFDPTTATAKASASSQLIPVHWVYKVNNGLPVTASLNGISIGITIDALEVSINPNDLKRHVSMSGAVSGSYNGQSFGGDYNATVEDLLFTDSGKTYFSNESLLMGLTLSGGGDTASMQLTSNMKNITPPYEWFLDRDNLDQLALNSTFVNNCAGTADFNIIITGQSPITGSNLSVTANDTWTFMQQLPTMTVQGITYTNVVKIKRTTQLPSISGNMTSASMYYWVAKGVGIIKGQGLYRVLNVDNVVIELIDSNLSQL